MPEKIPCLLTETQPRTEETLHWDFPLPRPHTGIAMANGTQGVLVWGEDRLCLTVARAGFWDHRGANPFTKHITFAEMRSLLEAGRESDVCARFSRQKSGAGQPAEPRQLAGGRLELSFPPGLRPLSADLHLPTGVLTILLGDRDFPDAHLDRIVLRQALDHESFTIDLSEAVAEGVTVTLVASYDASPQVRKELEDTGCAAPTYWQSAVGGGFRQPLPEDSALCVAWQRHGTVFSLTTALGGDAVPQTAFEREESAALATAWWDDYWRTVPVLNLPDKSLQKLHTYGLYKLAGLTHPGGVPATLQGAWMEEVRIPLWSNDYHFNINLEMIYQPLLSSGRTEHFAPLWTMMRRWMPQLRETARAFLQVEDALMLPHAVDDRCQVVGSFWKGTIDHASTAWMAQIAYQCYRSSGDKTFLRDTAYPLLKGAFNGFWAMAESVPGAEGAPPRLSLPISVSPEYGEGNPGGWGRDSSFQMAAWHSVARLLPRAAARLSEPIDPRWGRVARELPPYTTMPVSPGAWDTPGALPKRRIALWQGQDLEFSHRHHSHLAGLYPFSTIDPQNPNHAAVVRETLRHWITLGAGQWSAWSLPWAAAILARCDNANAALAWLHWLIETHANEGDTLSAGGLTGCNASWGGADENRRKPDAHEIMQADANMGIITAIHEILVQCRPVPLGEAGEAETAIYVLPQIPQRWKAFQFDRIHTEGGFVIGAAVERNRTVAVRVFCTRAEPLVLYPGLGPRWTLNSVPHSGDCLRLSAAAGQHLDLQRTF